MKDDLRDLFEREGNKHEEEMPEGHLDRFADKLNQSSRVVVMSSGLKWAASIIIILGLGYIFTKDGIFNDSHVDPILVDNKEEVLRPNTKGQVSDNVTSDLDLYFSKKVNVKVKELIDLGVADTTIINESLNELEVLEEEYAELKKKLAEVGNNKLIIKAMAKNYRTRLKLLDLLITRLEFNMDEMDPAPEVEMEVPQTL